MSAPVDLLSALTSTTTSTPAYATHPFPLFFSSYPASLSQSKPPLPNTHNHPVTQAPTPAPTPVKADSLPPPTHTTTQPPKHPPQSKQTRSPCRGSIPLSVWNTNGGRKQTLYTAALLHQTQTSVNPCLPYTKSTFVNKARRQNNGSLDS